MTLRTVSTFLFVLVIAVIASLYLSPMWSAAVVPSSSGPNPEWWSPAHILDFLDECALMVLAGAALPLLAPVRRPFLWGIALGATFCVIRLSLSSKWFSEDAALSTYVWAYSGHIVPVVFGGIGAIAAVVLKPKRAARAA
jgi:hypothetical protein